MRDGSDQSLPLGSTAIKPCHLGVHATFVQKNQALGVQCSLCLKPQLTQGYNVVATLFGSVARLFFKVWPWRIRNRAKADLLNVMPCSASFDFISIKVMSG